MSRVRSSGGRVLPPNLNADTPAALSTPPGEYRLPSLCAESPPNLIYHLGRKDLAGSWPTSHAKHGVADLGLNDGRESRLGDGRNSRASDYVGGPFRSPPAGSEAEKAPP